MQKDNVKIGDRYNFLTIIEEPYQKVVIRKNGYKQKIWMVKCKCDCGNTTDCIISAMIRNQVKSCGCYVKVVASKLMKDMLSKKQHNLCGHPLYHSWQAMKRACYNKNWNGYLGDGYTVYNEWNDNFLKFYEWAINNGWKEGLVLSRKDALQSFTPENCYFGKRRGINNPQKQRETFFTKYGTDSYFKTKEHKDRTKQVCLKKYGCEYFAQVEEFKQKKMNTILERYGKTNFFSPESFVKMQQTCLEKYGKPFYTQANLYQQKLIQKWLQSLGHNFESNYDIVDNKEIDLYNDDLKLGIEYCGIRWHTEHFGRYRTYHYGKYKACKDRGIRLLTIFSDEWKLHKVQIQGFIKSIINHNLNNIFARKCTVNVIDDNIGKQFINQYHVMGQSKCSLHYFGLFHNDALLGVMSFNKHHRQNHNNIMVLDRLVFKDGVRVVGGASKLLQHALKILPQNFDQIISWSDNRWSDGNVYEKMGFTLEKEYGPDYSYVKLNNPKKRVSKQSMSKKKIGCPDNFTEGEYCKTLGYSRIWDCGKKRWSLIPH